MNFINSEKQTITITVKGIILYNAYKTAVFFNYMETL